MSPGSRPTLVSFLLSLLALTAEGATVTGRVSSSTGAPLAGKTVAAYDANGVERERNTTDGAGLYTLTVAAGRYRLLAYDVLGAYATEFFQGADSFESTALVQVTDSAAFTANFTLREGAVVGGRVLTANGPLASALVEAYNLSGTRRGSTTANAAGEYSLVLPAGEYKLFAYDANGFFAGEFHVDTRAFSEAVPVRVTPPSPLNLTFLLERAARVSGRISDASTGTRLDTISVYAYTAAGALVAQTVSDAAGVFRFNLGPAQYRFVAADPDLLYGPAFFASGRSFERAEIVTLTAGQERTDLNMLAERGAVVTGRATGAANGRVFAYNLDGTVHASTAIVEGEYRFVLAPGVYKIALVDAARTGATRFHRDATTFAAASEIRVVGGELLTGIDLFATAAGRFTGTVTDVLTQIPLSGMTVAAYDATGALAGEATTSATGAYSLSVAAGTYRVLVYDTRFDYATAYANGATTYETTAPRTIASGEVVPLELRMRRGTRVTGTVRANGITVEGVEVFALDATDNRVAGTTTTANGAFTIPIAPGTYGFTVTDPRGRYLPLTSPVTVTVGNAPPAPLSFTLTPAFRRRAARH